MSAAELFTAQFSGEPDGVFSAPGRVNLIGEHTDYSGGLVLPFAIDFRARVAARALDEPLIRLVSAQRPGGVIEAPLSVLTPGSASATGWPAYVLGTVWSLIEAGIELPGAELALDSAVPAGAGLSSSAAVECATGLAMSTLAGITLTGGDLARICQRAENDFVGVPSGLMDQMASATCRQGHLLFFDVGAGRTTDIPFRPQDDGLQVLVIDTRAHHSLADGEYAKRRADCERAADLLGLKSLRDITDADAALARLTASAEPMAEVLARRVRHVVSENARVQRVVTLLDGGRSGRATGQRAPGPTLAGAISTGRAIDWLAVGAELTASHRSLRDDYEVSADELDTAVDSALDAGALGARMTGGGFGGSAIALVAAGAAESVVASVEKAFATAGFTAPVIRAVSPEAGARQDS